MSVNTNEIIFPCPFSRGYGIPAKQAWLLLKIFLGYRLTLACLFIFLFYSHLGFSLLGIYNDQLYLYSSGGYLILSVLSAICIARGYTDYASQAQLLIFTDILFLTFLMHACGGVSSGMGTLLAVSIASGGLLIGGRCAMAFAALASLSVLAEQIFAGRAHGFDPASYTYGGMLGAAFFTIALLSYILAKRSEETLRLTNQQKQTIVKLEELNRYIIQHLQSGIIIINKQQTVLMVNEASLRLTKLAVPPLYLGDVSAHLSLTFQAWLTNPEQVFAPLPLSDQPETHIHFIELPIADDFFYMIMLEDISLYNQRLQQSKLASLGQLTASIAHEIRNPLGAISHAAQLLSENPDLSSQDQRLTEIIQVHSIRVNHIIDDILRLSRRTASRREKIHLNSWLDNYLKNFTLGHPVFVDAFKLSHFDEPLYAFIDTGHLRQIMDNLCQNALRYGKPEAGPIAVHIFTFQQIPCIEMIDNGSGISPEQVKHLFEPFFTTSPTGTGLGLYISRELAELNQAKLSYHLTENNQSCFRLCLLDAEKKLIEI